MFGKDPGNYRNGPLMTTLYSLLCHQFVEDVLVRVASVVRAFRSSKATERPHHSNAVYGFRPQFPFRNIPASPRQAGVYCLGDGQTDVEEIQTQGGCNDALSRRMISHLT